MQSLMQCTNENFSSHSKTYMLSQWACCCCLGCVCYFFFFFHLFIYSNGCVSLFCSIQWRLHHLWIAIYITFFYDKWWLTDSFWSNQSREQIWRRFWFFLTAVCRLMSLHFSFDKIITCVDGINYNCRWPCARLPCDKTIIRSRIVTFE